MKIMKVHLSGSIEVVVEGGVSRTGAIAEAYRKLEAHGVDCTKLEVEEVFDA